jgi:hypothetical protein
MSHNGRLIEEKHIVGATPFLIAARKELSSFQREPVHQIEVRGFKYTVRFQEQSLWVEVLWPNRGCLAGRLAYIPIPGARITNLDAHDSGARISVDCDVGVFHVTLETPEKGVPMLHWRTALAPAEDLMIANWAPDLYPLDDSRNPLGVGGVVHTADGGPTGAMAFVTVTRPWEGSCVYIQYLTELNKYFESTRTSPNNLISDEWPELGFRLPDAASHALPAGQETVVSDAYLLATTETPGDKLQAGRLFLDMYAQIYLALPRPEAMFRDWPRLVDETMRDLTHSSACGVDKDGDRYLLAYVGANDRPPESMVQLAVLVPMIEYAQWLGEDIKLTTRLRQNLARFYNAEAKTMVRWLPGEEHLLGKEEHMSEEVMDSWYLYHTYLNLSRLAQDGDDDARRLFLDSIDYGIKVARHFGYHWPVFYNLHTLETIKAQTKPGRGGEHDVGAQYVHVMMQAWDLTGERRFLEEAERSAQELKGLGFDLGYQFNNTMFGAGGLLRLWIETGNQLYRDLSYVCIANVVRNFWLWECKYGYAKSYHTFLGLVPLRDAQYLALYEELETLAAFHEYLEVGGEDVPASIRLLLCEYCKYVIDRTWYHYPGELPIEAVAEKPKSGHINRELAIPLEDIYEGWQKAGQVGQEVYGAAAPFVFATRHCHLIRGVKFRIHCDYPIEGFKARPSRGHGMSVAGTARFRLLGDRRCHAHVRVVPDDYNPLPQVTLKTRRGRTLQIMKGDVVENGYLEFKLPGNAEVVVTWRSESGTPRRNRAESNGSASSTRRKRKGNKKPRPATQ